MKKSIVFAFLCLLWGGAWQNLSAEEPYEVPDSFMNLFYNFTANRSKDPKVKKLSATQILFDSMNEDEREEEREGSLILIVDSNLYVYDNEGNKLLDLPIRASKKNGFFEMTAVSHIGPALAYFAKAKENGSQTWQIGLESLLENIRSTRRLNLHEEGNWVDRVEAFSWQPFKAQIKNMVDYALRLSESYLERVLETGEFDIKQLEKEFFSVSTDEFPVPFNNVMIGTFMVTALESLDSMASAFKEFDLNWSQAKVLMKFVPGRNLSAGLTQESNWLVPALQAISNHKLPSDRILITPYMKKTGDLGGQALSEKSLEYYKESVWEALYARSMISKSVFSFIPSLEVSDEAPLPANYSVTKSHNIDDFILRLKFSLENPTEMLSNTVAFWIAGEYAAKRGHLESLDLPGLTTGFPEGVRAYPEAQEQAQVLIKHQELETSGAREITPFSIEGEQYLAVPQLAYDDLSRLPSMNGGAEAPVLIYKQNLEGYFDLYQEIPGHHNESAEFFQIDGQSYLAICSVSQGDEPPYENHSTQSLYKWDGKLFREFQEFEGYASKGWTYFELEGKHFLGLANGVVIPGDSPEGDTRSHLFQWNGSKFEKFQSFNTLWAYKFTSFQIGEERFLGLTDHLQESQIYRWNGKRFEPFQSFDKKGGRVFHHFQVENVDYVALANIFSDSTVYRYDGEKFVFAKKLEGQGGRNFLHFKSQGEDYLLKLVFITGTRQNPQSQHISPLYHVKDGDFVEVGGLQTSGAVAASKFTSQGKDYIAVANSLTKDIRFAAKSQLYRF